jgi:tRNA (guanosine-2'-O-)-methyltransferase
MYGFAESLNVSVSVAIILNELRNRLKDSTIDWKLTNEERLRTKLSWCRKHLKSSELIENEIKRRFLEKEL